MLTILNLSRNFWSSYTSSVKFAGNEASKEALCKLCVAPFSAASDKHFCFFKVRKRQRIFVKAIRRIFSLSESFAHKMDGRVLKKWVYVRSLSS